ncbi:MAG: phosphoadenylyl-sulfate reductase, partial [Kiloniellales bacterium]|nr:phosphoadenylyl-sulfate reductase [Kiloniellales bacterium]
MHTDIAQDPANDAERLAADLAAAYRDHDGQDLLEPMIRQVFAGRIAAVSSFGTESAVLLAMV